MEKGQLRCDANISVRPVGTETLGTKVEIKNLNTISGVKNGVEYEIKRQIKAIEAGEEILQETRRWNPDQRYTAPMRSKEMAHDYRYFPDPDLMPVKISQEWIDRVKETVPEKPFDKQRRYMEMGSLLFSPNRKAGVGAVGVRITSTSSNTRVKSSRIKVLVF